MIVKRKLDFRKSGASRSYLGDFDEPSFCPMCKHAIKPQELYLSTFEDEDDNHFLSVFYLCKHCYQTFIVLHKCNTRDHGGSYTYSSEFLYSAPNRFAAKEFDDSINKLSPQFVKIYNQSLAAETMDLDEIAGLGYRKALEFLIKDFCIHLRSDEEEKIKKLPLAQCINTYISSPEIKTLASRAAWIGNDEAHYVRKQEDRDVSDMKKFITAAVYFIGMVLITEDAAGMAPA